jgi:small nuclear ribonucleoprotein B and B'
MLHYVNYRMRVVLTDSRTLVGTFMAFDRHMNMVLGDAEEYRRIKSKKGQGISEEKEEKRALGLVILRGDSVVSMSIEGPPPPEDDSKLIPGGPGIGRAAGRGLPVAPLAGAPTGLAGPVRGVGGPAASFMQPPAQVAAQAGAQSFPRPPGMMPPGMMPPGMPPGRGPPGMPPGMMPPPPGMMPPGMMPPGMPPGMMPPGMPPGMMPPGMMPPGMGAPPRGPPPGMPPGMMPPRGS